jgi:hypothetical protein
MEDDSYDRIAYRLASLEKELESRLSLHCLALCQSMHQKPPRELRDMVYELLLEIRIWPVDGATLGHMRKRSYIPIYRYAEMRYLTGKDCVGIAIKQELAEAYYRLMTCVFRGDSGVPHRVKSFLYAVDPWHSLTRVGRFVKTSSYSIQTPIWMVARESSMR